jgi:hypothetical protein
VHQRPYQADPAHDLRIPVNPRERRGRAGRRDRKRHTRLRLLLAIAIGVPVALMGGLTAEAVVTHTSCTDRPLAVNVAVTQDILPAIQRVGSLFNRQAHEADGRCVQVRIIQEQPADVAGQVDGQSSSSGLPTVDAWIPDSSLWVDAAHAYPVGARQVQSTGISVARSPLMIVMPGPVAAQVPQFNNSIGWNFLLPSVAGSLGLRVELPDPTQSAAGLATLAEVSRVLGSSSAAQTQLTQFVLSVQSSVQFDTPTELGAFEIQAAPPLNAHPVTVTTEQAVLGFDAAHPTTPLAAVYPSGPATLADPENDYPFAITTTNQAEIAGAKEFGAMLQQSYTASIVRHDGFRSGNGTPGTIPAADELAQQPLELAKPVTPAEAQTGLEAWHRLVVGARDLALIDVSSSMNGPSGIAGLTLEQEMTDAARLGLALFPDSTQIGLWEFGDGINGSVPYKSLVSVGPLPGELGLISRRQQVQQIVTTLHPLSGPASIDDAILAAYKKEAATYQAGLTNAVIVLTSGVDDSPTDMPASQLETDLKALYNPDKRVELIIVVVGTQGNQQAMQQIAADGGGAAFSVTSPAQIDQVFFEGVSRRVCQGSGCTT